MSLTKCEKTETNKYKLEFSVDKEIFNAAIGRAYKKAVVNMNVPGFRKGKAPKAIIEKMYGKGVFYEDAINEVLPVAYDAAIKETELKTVGQPEFDVVSADENGVALSAVVYVKPEVEISDYVGIEVKKTVVPVTDEEIDAEIKTVQERNSREIEVEGRAAAIGDVANIDYEGFCDGVAFEGGKGESHPLKLGSNQFIPGFEEKIVGHSIGDKFDVNVTFPEDYHAKELAGKAVVFKTKINSLNIVELPALDDEFAKDVSEFDTFDEYRSDIKDKIQERHDKNADNEVEEQLVNALIEKLKTEIPEPMFVAETENFVRDYDSKLRMQGLDLKTYFKYTGLTLDSMREQFRPQAERQVKTRLALEKIASLEKLEAKEEDISKEYDDIAAQYGVAIDQVKSSIAAEDIAEDMKVKLAMELVKEKAVIVEADAQKKETAEIKEAVEKKVAPKKATTKKTTAKKAEEKAE